jgi:hypothetical protein
MSNYGIGYKILIYHPISILILIAVVAIDSSVSITCSTNALAISLKRLKSRYFRKVRQFEFATQRYSKKG